MTTWCCSTWNPAGRLPAVQGSAQGSGRTTTWLTPPHITAALGGPDSFDLDPCAHPGWVTARQLVSLPTDGLSVGWHGRVWLNPPYGAEAWTWLARLADHADQGGSGTALVFARTETAGFVETVWERATGLLFLAGRLTFHLPDGNPANANSGGPSVLIAYGQPDADVLATCSLPGSFITGWRA